MIKVIFGVGLLLCFCSLIYGYKDCGSVAGEIVSVQISGCSTSDRRCALKRNTTVTMDITFKTNVDSDTLSAVVHGVILGVPVPFDLPNPNGCKDSGIACPVKNGQTYKYSTTMPIKTEYPKVTVDIKWEIQNTNGDDILCALIPSKIA